MTGNFGTGKQDARPRCQDCDALLNNKSRGTRCQLCWARLQIMESRGIVMRSIAAWRAVEPTDNTSTRNWTQTAISCLLGQRNCLSCDVQKIHDISYTNGCHMPSAVQALIDRGTAVPHKFVKLVMEGETDG